MNRHKPHIPVLLTAGHAATTALAVIEELNSDQDTHWGISWIGPKRALTSSTHTPFELELFPTLDVKVYAITAGKLHKKFTRYTIPDLFKLPIGFWQAFWLVRRIKPKAVLSFGGFASVPVVFTAWCMGIPICLQDQVAGGGLSNMISSRFATKIAVAREESLSVFPKEKTVVLGNPLTREVLGVRRKTALRKTKTLYITGGSRGAQRVNNLVFQSLDALLSRFNVIHQTGVLDYEKAKQIRANLPESARTRYSIHDFVDPMFVSKVYEKADIVLGRAGANTVAEIMAIGIPAIFIPIPWSIGNEQMKNAKFAEKVGVAYVLPERNMSKSTLLRLLTKVEKNYKGMVNAAQSHKSLDRTAARAVASLLSSIV